jgi:hypothetical protein
MDRQSPDPQAPSAGRIVVVALLSIVALIAHLAIGVLYLYAVSLVPRPGAEWARLVVNIVLAGGWLGFSIAIFWAWARLSFLVIAIPFGSIGFVLVVGTIGNVLAPSTLGIGY